MAKSLLDQDRFTLDTQTNLFLELSKCAKSSCMSLEARNNDFPFGI